MLLAAATIGAVAVVVVPRYEAHLVETRMTEAFSLANEAKTGITEFYLNSNRFPQNESEAASISTFSSKPPEYVREVRVNPDSQQGEVAIEIYFKEDALAEGVSAEHYVYLAGTASGAEDALLEWRCGTHGIDSSYLPPHCKQ